MMHEEIVRIWGRLCPDVELDNQGMVTAIMDVVHHRQRTQKTDTNPCLV